MQKKYYEDSSISSAHIVGSYRWHENFPYESQLLYKRGDFRFPLFETTTEKVALDFACGPGRMVGRMSHLFKRVDGVDISQVLIDEARENHSGSNFYVSSGDDLGSVPSNTYDFIYSTIAMQHIAVRSIRLKILQEFKRVLKDGGKFTIQMAFNPDFPYVINKGSVTLGDYKVRLLKKDNAHASWNENKIDAKETNGHCDVGISYGTLPDSIKDFESVFDDVDFWFYDTRLIFDNLAGEKHGAYWASHWIFISGEKRAVHEESKEKDIRRRNLWSQRNYEFAVPDKNSFMEVAKRIARKSKYYEPLKKSVKKIFNL